MPHKEFPKKTIAAIDIGTNSAHMAIAEMDHVGEMRILDSDKVNLRLGQAIGDDGNLSAEAIDRTVQVLSHMQEIIKPYKATTRAVATHATREAKNHKRLLQEIQKASGIKVEMIDGIEEARLVFLGMRYGLSLNGIECLGVDVGGGSTEIIVARDDEIDFVSSIKLGAVTLTDRYFKKGASNDGYKDMLEHIRSRLAPLQQEARRFDFTKALASSGTAKALAFLHARRLGTEMSDPNGYVLPRDALFKIGDEFAKLMTPAKIKEATGLDQSRSEIILAGTLILQELTRLLKVKEWIITSFGLREGLVADTFYRAYGQRESGELPDIQWHSVLQFAKRLGLNEGHGAQVKRLALRLLDQLTPIVRPDASDDERDGNVKLLKAAAYLREAGKFLSAPQYHHHSQYLISNSRLPGFTESERQLMGLIARFQRKALPSADHQECLELSGGELKRLRFLAAIVRLAAALDRTRQTRVSDVDVTPTKGDDVTITLAYQDNGSGTPDVELHKAKLEKNALEKSWGLNLKFATRAAAGGK